MRRPSALRNDRPGERGPLGPDTTASLREEARLLHTLGISKPLLARMARTAMQRGTTIEQELLSSGEIEEDAYFAGLARMYGLPFLAEIPAELVDDHRAIDSQLTEPRMLRLHYPNRPPVMALVPTITQIESMRVRLKRSGNLADACVTTTPSAIRRAVWQVGEERRAHQAVHQLFEKARPLSARLVVTGDQGFLAGLFLSVVTLAATIAPYLSLSLVHFLVSAFHLGGLFLRLFVVAYGQNQPLQKLAFEGDAGAVPIYTVMVAIYREAAVVPQLLAALDALDWPKSRLDIKLVCEADDAETLAAIRAAGPGPHIEVIAVPSMAPRTKPKALTYALAGARGSFVTIYDAEDRPHPQQLREAYHSFCMGPPDLVCLQAPLVIANAGESWVSAIFALEYTALFRRLLPALGFHRMPLPLGGTSNHFRAQALIESGGWDPYNVTEDADLGMRLYRMGYRAATLTLPTFEDAPVNFRVWLGQRTRWYKGWLQTWLVMMRQPIRTCREMGWLSFLVSQLLVGGMLVAALSHPGMLIFVTLSILSLMQIPAPQPGVFTSMMLGIDIFNIIGSYAVFFALGATPMTDREKHGMGWKWAMIPVYWMGVSLAAWKAVIELRLRPFYWNKTPHSPSRVVIDQRRNSLATATSSSESA
ncbi:glycosyltransferase family 2 protein [Rhizobium sp. AG855]|uniref:glycosyltransferase family 2 protein n=1 Tax=Rhizobium sp. AG855 TaxID=2183898 RepID=UPI000E750F56|nr:glycosyltransferase family 2 protein [Rhizobium sp. AG855]RKE86331.1 cellulose synthase/poly-beta-1,6-N-acetylglucosamine synthase-like glycosyltransferase [Rhizobium sp. AG855]